MAGRQRTTFAKLQRERARQEKQAAKRARRQGLEPREERNREPEGFDPGFGPDGEVPEWLKEASASSSQSSSDSNTEDAG
jgi:hypothetical protein